MVFAELSGPAFLVLYTISLIILIVLSGIVRNTIVYSLGTKAKPAPGSTPETEPEPASLIEDASGTGVSGQLPEHHTPLSEDLAAIAKRFGDTTPIRADLDYGQTTAASFSPPLPG